MHQSEPGVTAPASLQMIPLAIFFAFKTKQVHSETKPSKKLGAKPEQIKSIVSRIFRTSSFQDLILE